MTIEDMVNEVGFWDEAQTSFNEAPHNSQIRQVIGQRIYRNPAVFAAVANDTVDDNIKTQTRAAYTTWIDYAQQHKKKVLDKFDTNLLFSEHALKFCPEYQSLKVLENNPGAKKQAMLQMYERKLTNYSASDSHFMNRLYESTLDVEYMILVQNLSKESNPAKGLDKVKVKDYVSNGLSRLDDNSKRHVYGEFAKTLYKQFSRA